MRGTYASGGRGRAGVGHLPTGRTSPRGREGAGHLPAGRAREGGRGATTRRVGEGVRSARGTYIITRVIIPTTSDTTASRHSTLSARASLSTRPISLVQSRLHALAVLAPRHLAWQRKLHSRGSTNRRANLSQSR